MATLGFDSLPVEGKFNQIHDNSSKSEAFSRLRNKCKSMRTSEILPTMCQGISFFLDNAEQYPLELRKLFQYQSYGSGVCQGLALIYLLLMSEDFGDVNKVFESVLAALLGTVNDKSYFPVSEELLQACAFLLVFGQKVAIASSPSLWRLRKGLGLKEQLSRCRENYKAISSYLDNPWRLINIIELVKVVSTRLDSPFLSKCKTCEVAKTLCVFDMNEEDKLADFLEETFQRFDEFPCSLYIGFDDHAMILLKKGDKLYLLGVIDQNPFIPLEFSVESSNVWRQIASNVISSSPLIEQENGAMKFSAILFSREAASSDKVGKFFEEQVERSISKMQSWILRPITNPLDVTEYPLVDISCLRQASIYFGKGLVQKLIRSGDSNPKNIRVADHRLKLVHGDQLDPEFQPIEF